MKNNKNDIQILLIALGILIAVLVWQFFYNPNMEEAALVKTENETLRQTIIEMEVLEVNKDTYVKDIATMKEECDEIIELFSSYLTLEDVIMYLYDMENVAQNQVVVPAIAFSEAVEVPYEEELTVGDYTLEDDGIRLMDSAETITLTTTYSGLKNVINYIYEMPTRKAISEVNLSIDDNGYLSGTISTDFYALLGTEKMYTPIEINGVSLGKNNIFGVLERNMASRTAEEETAEETTED